MIANVRKLKLLWNEYMDDLYVWQHLNYVELELWVVISQKDTPCPALLN